ncbi:HK97 gp10 family phage protein [Corynebacterium incognita]|uniref:HK97 gp10 family phage protein n=1 Tax=Corynebacterium incognita TaxID=2754725 RepID=A0A7G7CRP1_9CORY|nr:HK97-gp10 family putative phage morphogenesis protein [Corynebacterium incognita]QNE90257.1 HK97 gp10 family phage protein [Corynebacterium incognita]
MADLDWRGQRVIRNIEKAAEMAARAGAELVLDEARQRAPVETGTLRGDSKVTVDGTQAAVAFGLGPSKAYARRQHEEVGWQHQDGQAKYLETALLDKQGDVKRLIADEMRKAL